MIQENEPLSLDSLALVTPLKNRTPIVAQTQVSPSRLEPRPYAAVYRHVHIFEPVPGVGVSFEQAVENAVHNIQYNRTGERISSEITNPGRECSPLMKVAKVRMIRFPWGRTLEYTEGDCPVAPAMDWKYDISRLFREWEDQSSRILNIKGVGVPPRYWGRIYRGTTGWSVIKQSHSEARVSTFVLSE